MSVVQLEGELHLWNLEIKDVERLSKKINYRLPELVEGSMPLNFTFRQAFD